MDNAGSHRNKTTKELIIKSGNKILHSVPYRPSTNAIESWFSQFKKLLYNQPGLNYKDILKNVKSAFRFMKSQKHLNYFKYAYRRQKIKDIINIKKSNKEKKLKKYKSE